MTYKDYAIGMCLLICVLRSLSKKKKKITTIRGEILTGRVQYAAFIHITWHDMNLVYNRLLMPYAAYYE